ARSPLFPYTTLFRSNVPSPMAMARMHGSGLPRLPAPGIITHFLNAFFGFPAQGFAGFFRVCPASRDISRTTWGQRVGNRAPTTRSEEHTSELQSREN